jgi:hypothetical protein
VVSLENYGILTSALLDVGDAKVGVKITQNGVYAIEAEVLSVLFHHPARADTEMLVTALIGATLMAEAIAAPRPLSPQAVFQTGKEADIVDLILAAQSEEQVKDGQKWNWTVVNEIDPLKRAYLF